MLYFCKKSREFYMANDEALVSSASKIQLKLVGGYKLPIFCRQNEGFNEFSSPLAVQFHENAMRWLLKTHRTTDDKLRSKLIGCIPKIKEERPKILVTGCGEGRDIPHLLRKFPMGEFYIQDIALEMLECAVVSTSNSTKGRRVHFWCGDACNLPFDDLTFDLVYHFGGLNLFSDIRRGIEEAHRVLKFKGGVLMGDEGIAPFLYNDEISKALIKNNPLYGSKAPLDYLSPFISNFRLEYILNNCFYVISYIKERSLDIDLSVPHVGKRGGSINTRHYGELEGISPELRARLYDRSLRLGVSRVDLLERFIARGLEDA